MAHGTLMIVREISGAIEAEEASPPLRRRRVPSAVRVSLLTAGWLIVAVLGLVALLRLVAWDSVEPLIVLNALTFVVYLPAWVVAAAALITRHWWLAAAAVLIVAAQLVFVMPELSAAAPLPAWAEHAPAVRVFDANLGTSRELPRWLRAGHRAGPPRPGDPRRAHAAGAAEHDRGRRASAFPLSLRGAGLAARTAS